MAAPVVRGLAGVLAVVRNVSINYGTVTSSRLASSLILLYHCRNYCQSTQGGDGADRPNKGSNSKLDAVRPSRAFEARKKAKDSKISSAVGPAGLDAKLVSAVDNVAESIGADQRKIRSDLLKKLQEHSLSREKLHSEQDVSSLLAGMEVEKMAGSNDSKRQISTKQKYQAFSGDRRAGESADHSSQRTRERAYRFGREGAAGTKLFDGRALGIFSAKHALEHHALATSTPTLFDILEHEESERYMAMPPENRFEEMIQWTKEGKLWKFPIDNEQGMDDELKVGFHEHVFIEQLVDSRFPARGPIRQFMELVAVGLSANPYLTVAEKHAHVTWYANYFKDKYRFVDQAQQVLNSKEDAEMLSTEAQKS